MTLTGDRYCGASYERATFARVARPPMKNRNFRASDKSWDDAQATADAAEEVLADRLREFIDWYGRQPGARPPRRPDKAVRAKDVQRRDDEPPRPG